MKILEFDPGKLSKAEQALLALSMLENLSKKKALIFIGRHYFDMTLVELSKTFNITFQGIAKDLAQAREALAAMDKRGIMADIYEANDKDDGREDN